MFDLTDLTYQFWFEHAEAALNVVTLAEFCKLEQQHMMQQT